MLTWKSCTLIGLSNRTHLYGQITKLSWTLRVRLLLLVYCMFACQSYIMDQFCQRFHTKLEIYCKQLENKTNKLLQSDVTSCESQPQLNYNTTSTTTVGFDTKTNFLPQPTQTERYHTNIRLTKVLHPASCILHYASCIMHHSSCIMHHATSKQGRRLKFGMLTVLTNIRSTKVL